MNIQFISGTITLINDTLYHYPNYSPELEALTEKWWPLLEKMTEREINLIRAMCHTKNLIKLRDILEEKALAYADN